MDKEQGLTSAKAKDQLIRFGRNVLPEKPPPSDIKILLSQLKNPLVYILVTAFIVTLLLKHASDALIVLSAVVINTLLGFVQERKASRALYALKKLLHPKAEVVRDGRRIVIDAEEVVPGDVVILNQGSKVPADGSIIKASRMFVNEAILTGESVPVVKDKKAPVFMGTVVISGQGRMLVEKTGEETKVGLIASKIQEKEEGTPLQKQLKKFSKNLSYFVFGLTLFVFLVGILTGENVAEMFATSVALAVSAIPEGLLVGLTVVLAVGMQRVLKKKGLVRRLVSAETLGGVSVICVDKTGTLTEGEMKVVDVIGDERKIVKQMILANDLDDPILAAADIWARSKNQEFGIKNQDYKRLDSLPFSSKDRFFASLHPLNLKKNIVYVNGAPDFVVGWTRMSAKEKLKVNDKIEELTGEGKRVMGLARKEVNRKTTKLTKKLATHNLEWVALVAFTDPVREGVKEAFGKTQKAGIETMVITGDYPKTAVSVMKQLGLAVEEKQIMTGKQLDRLTPENLAAVIRGVKLFARTTPEQKLEIVTALKENKEVVAMMGDGVNDAPALKHADIGIVVGEATDVAKETADLVLLDSNYATIVEAIEEGRGIFENIRKIILYLLADAFEEILAVVGTILLGLPLPVTAGQILWINLVSDGFPDLALTIDPKSKEIMKAPPREYGESVVTGWMKVLIVIISLVGGLFALGLFAYFYVSTQDVILARSVAFSALGVNSLVFVFSVRTLTHSFWKENPLKNIWLNLAVLVGLVFQFVPLLVPGMQRFFGLVYPGHVPVLIVFTAAVLMFILIETVKALVRKKMIWFQY